MNITIAEKTITVKTLYVDGMRMSKAFFNQIPEANYKQYTTALEAGDLLGYVVDNTSRIHGTYILLTLNGVLHKKWFEEDGSSVERKATYASRKVGLEQLYIGG